MACCVVSRYLAVGLLVALPVGWGVSHFASSPVAATPTMLAVAPATQPSTPTTKPKIFNTMCPVGKEKVDPEAPTVEYKGKTIGFCCAGCEKDFLKDPEKYMKDLK